MAVKLLSLCLIGASALSLRFIEGIDTEEDPVLNE
jgi:hypothetical protein